MRRLFLCLPLLLLAGCTAEEPLSPAFAGEWASAMRGCGGPRISLSKSGISAVGMPIDGVVFTKSDVSGATAHLVMEPSVAARAASAVWGSRPPQPRLGEVDPRNVEVVATLIASGNRVSPTNVLFRDKKSRQVQAAHPDILAIVTLVRCGTPAGGDRPANMTFRDAARR